MLICDTITQEGNPGEQVNVWQARHYNFQMHGRHPNGKVGCLMEQAVNHQVILQKSDSQTLVCMRITCNLITCNLFTKQAPES